MATITADITNAKLVKAATAIKFYDPEDYAGLTDGQVVKKFINEQLRRVIQSYDLQQARMAAEAGVVTDNTIIT